MLITQGDYLDLAMRCALDHRRLMNMSRQSCVGKARVSRVGIADHGHHEPAVSVRKALTIRAEKEDVI